VGSYLCASLTLWKLNFNLFHEYVQDIFDKELNETRTTRWEKAFSETITTENNALRATIVIEHIMQASDVCHTMQHWHIYRKWNKRLFFEMMDAFTAGRMAVDPATFWYKGELSFFDTYIIPLSKKLKECNVFGVSSDECLNYAVHNRAEWEACGEEIVEEMMKAYMSPAPASGTGVDWEMKGWQDASDSTNTS